MRRRRHVMAGLDNVSATWHAFVIVQKFGRPRETVRAAFSFGRCLSKPRGYSPLHSADYVRRTRTVPAPPDPKHRPKDRPNGAFMTAEVIQFVPRPDPNREARLKRMAAEAFGEVFPNWPDFSQAETFHAPDKDSA